MAEDSGACLNRSNKEGDSNPMKKVMITVIGDGLYSASEDTRHEGDAEKIDNSKESSSEDYASLFPTDPEDEFPRGAKIWRSRISYRNMVKGSR